MTEEEWLACEYPGQMFQFLGRIATSRKLRLFCCACCRRIWELLPGESRVGVETSERFADGMLTVAECKVIFQETDAVAVKRGRPWSPDAFTFAISSAAAASTLHATTVPMGISTASTASQAAGRAAGEAGPDADYDRIHDAAVRQEAAAQSHLVREIFGNPFHLVLFSPAWRTDTAMALARQGGESQDFSTLPILADALQDAGCDNEQLLHHLRDANATHVRGCWALDLVLGKG